MPKLTKKDIGIFSFARKQSQRCPNKMLRPFGKATLTDIVLEKLGNFKQNSFFAGYEPEFKDKCAKHGVRFVQRSQKSATIDEPITEILSFLKDLEYDYFLIVNACLPFLRVESIEKFLNKCLEQDFHPAFAVIKRHNFYMTAERKPLNFSLSLKTINTKAVEPVYEFAHALYFFKKDYFFKNGRYWDWKDVRLTEIDNKLELVDIDTEEDFEIAEGLYNIKKGKV